MIKKLPDEVIKKISAGEVVENPASCVRELIENSLDADAKHIKVSIWGGGIDVIEVEDDGIGMPPEEIPLAVQRFTTSKISSFEDLKHLKTLGFRGEALYAIAQVSNLTIVSSASDDVVSGWECIFDAGELTSSKPAPRKRGTTVVVKDLFFNLPVRRNFLLSKREEGKRVFEELISYALWHTEVYFEYYEDGSKKLDLPPGDFAQRIISVFGKEFIERAILFNYRDEYLSIEGFIEKPEMVDQKGHEQIILVNGRRVRGDQLRRVIYRSFEKPYGQPDFVIKIEIEPEFVDFNIHPQKREVKVAPYIRITEKLYKALTNSFRQYSKEIVDSIKVHIDSLSSARVSEQYGGTRQLEFGEAFQSLTLKNVPKEGQTDLLNIWQAHKSYIFVQTSNGIMIIDQHAAHERIIYEKLRKKDFSSQMLMFPILVELSAKEKKIFDMYKELFNSFGFDFRFLGSGSLVIDKVPAIFRSVKKEDIKDLIASLDESPSLPDRLENFLKTVACKSAIKFGDELSKEEMEKLVDELMASDTPFYCPHGRPTIYFISLDELASKFER
ncbi:MAG: DNA mismatch repair endonuclease MutL [bacterium]|nr:DNA mismatch repair endonuclease MutL [bacterium]